MPEVKAEHTRWRDLGLSLRHRAWGFDAPMVDIDLLAIEYDLREPVALISYKLAGAQAEGSANLEAFCKLALMARLPAFEVRYTQALTGFQPIPLVHQARQLMEGHAGRFMSEREYVQWLYWLRGRTPPADVLRNLKETLQP